MLRSYHPWPEREWKSWLSQGQRFEWLMYSPGRSNLRDFKLFARVKKNRRWLQDKKRFSNFKIQGLHQCSAISWCIFSIHICNIYTFCELGFLHSEFLFETQLLRCRTSSTESVRFLFTEDGLQGPMISDKGNVHPKVVTTWKHMLRTHLLKVGGGKKARNRESER